MKCFYEINRTAKYQEALNYSFGLHGYLQNINSLREHIALKNINKCHLVKASKGKKPKKSNNNEKHLKKPTDPTHFVKAYFPPLVKADPVKNSYGLAKHVLLTGPNAAGKTTLLKTTLFNIILTQQIGYGFYGKGSTLCPYDILHCYINIPDTSGRDSLFQAEARRCKDILDSIVLNGTQHLRHFCVFDELYSGTNPYEAIGSAYGFLKHLNTFNNVTFLLTTHYLEICHRLMKEPNVENYHMEILEKNGKGDFTYTYKLKEGMSTVKGGVKVLRELNYPNDVINNATQVIAELHI
jgi:DNA mismatch repair ATPase MutS